MEILKKYGLTPMKALKLAGLVIVGLIFLTLAISLISSSFQSFRGTSIGGSLTQKSADFAQIGGGTGGMAESPAYNGTDSYDMGLSARNVASEIMPPEPSILPPGDETAIGDDAEEYEVTEYYVNVETGRLEDDCRSIIGLKGRDYVIFENANEWDRGCSYTFKVKKGNVAEILAVIESLDPKDMNENTQTIKKLVDDYTSELEILEKKLDSINDTLESAIISYDEITDVATRTRDAESLAKIIDSKIRIIERLTNERISVSAQMERIARAKAEQLDRLEYTYFYLSIIEDKFIDGERLADSWKAAVKDFVNDVNRIAQDITINLVAVLLIIVQYAVYLLLLVLVAKYGWKGTKWIWKM